MVIQRNEIARRGGIPLFQLLEKVFAVQTDLIFRLPELRKPKPEDQGDDRPGEEAVLKGGGHSSV